MIHESQKVLVLGPASAPSALDFFTVDLPFEAHCLRIKDNIPTYICPSISRATQMMSAFDGRFHIVAFGSACRYVAEAIELRAITGDKRFGTIILVEPHLKPGYVFDMSGVERVLVLHNKENVLVNLSSPWAGMGNIGSGQVEVENVSFEELGMKGAQLNQYSAIQKCNITRFKRFIIRAINAEEVLAA